MFPSEVILIISLLLLSWLKGIISLSLSLSLLIFLFSSEVILFNSILLLSWLEEKISLSLSLSLFSLISLSLFDSDTIEFKSISIFLWSSLAEWFDSIELSFSFSLILLELIINSFSESLDTFELWPTSSDWIFISFMLSFISFMDILDLFNLLDELLFNLVNFINKVLEFLSLGIILIWFGLFMIFSFSSLLFSLKSISSNLILWSVPQNEKSDKFKIFIERWLHDLTLLFLLLSISIASYCVSSSPLSVNWLLASKSISLFFSLLDSEFNLLILLWLL